MKGFPGRSVLLAAAVLAARPAARCSGAPAAEALQPGRPAEVYLAPGRATTIQLRTDRKVSAISLASPIVAYKYDKGLNQLELTPAVRSTGLATNLNLRIGECVYVLLVNVVGDARAQYYRCFVPDGAEDDDESALERARPLPPAEIDIVGAAETLVRAEADPVFRDARPNLRIETLGSSVDWNDCRIELVDLAQFVDRDLIVFRVRWVNRTADALYLDPVQYGLSIGGRSVPIAARYKVGIGPVVRPGRVETVFLAVQGYRLSRHNDWRLRLPPDAAALAGARP